ncbi:MAG: hypothetical protein COT92_02580 [Candidatus Doudnabacteria bacterium CG10_big_fil_rev_8_21_14_0_10_42_18]|uniref:Phage holin family protein n=1 Tax=Candidatus Doudnabacteria bacterium CG10_big_fil_rev_8_21_14_0_10_42_18 TaxID=1974552 RepID=A0A2H0VAR9_9BACT|nr:MAG: hypothetical protein COT92_02580 [Candidatus Doudnabacteria bacterium CG10_big_fil_rev_8_21_14_0_10_42_18]
MFAICILTKNYPKGQVWYNKSMYLFLRIIINALAVMLAANVVPGLSVTGFWTAVLVAVILGILNATLGLVLKVLTFPLSLVSFGFFLLVINALVFWAASFIKGFNVESFGAAFFGSLIVTVVSMIGKRFMEKRQESQTTIYH